MDHDISSALQTGMPAPASPAKTGRWHGLFKTICALLSVSTAALVLEMHYRRTRTPNYWTVAELESRSPDKSLPLRFDPELGFLPELNGGEYSSAGSRINSYPWVKGMGAARVLFLGDSVTARGKLISAIKGQYGSEKFEYWNAGVEGFNLLQEARFFDRYNFRIRPDQVVLTFHNNDFSVQPVLGSDRRSLSLYGPPATKRFWMPWPLTESEFVRRTLVRGYIKHFERASGSWTRAALDRLSQRLNEEGVAFTVALFPILRPLAAWEPSERTSRQRAIEILRDSGIRYIDLMPALERALADRVDLCEVPGDPWHPSDAAASYFARQLHAERLLREQPDRRVARTLPGE